MPRLHPCAPGMFSLHSVVKHWEGKASGPVSVGRDFTVRRIFNSHEPSLGNFANHCIYFPPSAFNENMLFT